MPDMRALDGLLLLDKPVGCTSNGVLQQVRRLFGAKKAGHTGSLDPSATGMLPICFGEGTKLCAYLLDAEKTYEVEGVLGQSTDTEDADGEIVAEGPVPAITQAQMHQTVQGFLGHSMQVPPAYSAIKRNGVRAHKLARKGVEVQLEPRAIEVKSIELLAFSADRFSLRLCVSKGTYIRSIVRDIGDSFGCGAHVSRLRRVSVSPFEQQRMYSIDEIQQIENKDSLLLAVDEVISDWQSLTLDSERAMLFRHGAKPQIDYAVETTSASADTAEDQSGGPSKDLLRIYDPSEKFLGLGKISDGRLETVRIIGGQLQ
ncbi:tRNA pseudouridine(55) synthase TruB [Chromatiales bacterium (ex Bugula neritina AB1)]|nr:tRNA pseudouridine(55) synthase TruB [Chromatiales bacterium (ex Bugula neritina AB1)]